MNQLRDPLLGKSLAPAAHPDDFGQVVRSAILSDFWPGIQLYYPPVKYAPALGIYEDLEAAAQRFGKHAHHTLAHTVIFDLEDGCRQKEMSRELLRRELPSLPQRRSVQVALRVNPFRTDEYEKDMELVRDMCDHVDVVMLAKAGEAYGAGSRSSRSSSTRNRSRWPPSSCSTRRCGTSCSGSTTSPRRWASRSRPSAGPRSSASS